jgi:hypothetical protein
VSEVIPLFGDPNADFMDLLKSAIEAGHTPPFIVPPAPARFFGYASELDTMALSLCSSPPSLYAVYGAADTGPASFAVALAHRLRGTSVDATVTVDAAVCSAGAAGPGSAFPGGIFYVDVRDCGSADAVASAVCAGLGVSVTASAVSALRAWCQKLVGNAVIFVDAGAISSGSDGSVEDLLLIRDRVTSAFGQLERISVVIAVSGVACDAADLAVRSASRGMQLSEPVGVVSVSVSVSWRVMSCRVVSCRVVACHVSCRIH